MSGETEKFLKRLAELLSQKTGQSYPDSVGYLRKRLRFDILRTTVIALRGHKCTGVKKEIAIRDIEMNMLD